MPELPEVEAQRAMLEAKVVGMRVTAINALEQGGGGRDGLFDDKVIAESMTAEMLTSKLTGTWIIAAKRRGKQLWLELGPALDAPPTLSLLLHLGMTGALVVRGGEGPKYKRLEVDMTVWPPRFTKLELILAGAQGSCALAYTDSRRFGRILLREGDATASLPISALAADPILNPPSAEDFCRMLSVPSTSVKAALLDQTRIVCGVGNWVADEVLFQAKILPSAPCNALSEEQARALHAAIIDVCGLACKADADSERFPSTWLFHHRWANMTTGSKNSPLGRIHFDTVGGRTTAFLPHVQKAAAGVVKRVASGGKSKGKRMAAEPEVGAAPPRKRARKDAAGASVAVALDESGQGLPAVAPASSAKDSSRTKTKKAAAKKAAALAPAVAVPDGSETDVGALGTAPAEGKPARRARATKAETTQPVAAKTTKRSSRAARS